MLQRRHIILLALLGCVGIGVGRAQRAFETKAHSIKEADRNSLGTSATTLKRLLGEMKQFSAEGKDYAARFKQLLRAGGMTEKLGIGQNGGNELLVVGPLSDSSKADSRKPRSGSKKKSGVSELYLKIADGQAILSAIGSPPGASNEQLTLELTLDAAGTLSSFNATTVPNAQLHEGAEEIMPNIDASAEANMRNVMRYLLAGGPSTTAKIIRRDGRSWVINAEGHIHTSQGYFRIYRSKKLAGLPFFIAHDFGPKDLISMETGDEVSAGHEDYLVVHETLFAKDKGKLYPHRSDTGNQMRSYGDEGHGFAASNDYSQSRHRRDAPGFVTSRDYRDHLGFIVGVDDKGLEYPIGPSGFAPYGFLPHTLRRVPFSKKIVGTLGLDRMDHVIELELHPPERRYESLQISPQAFEPHTLHLDEKLGILTGERKSLIVPFISDDWTWHGMKAQIDSYSPKDVEFKALDRSEAGTLIGTSRMLGEPVYHVVPENKGLVQLPYGPYAKTFVYPGSPFTVLVERPGYGGVQSRFVQIAPGPQLNSSKPLQDIDFAAAQFFDAVKSHGVFEGRREDQWEKRQVYFHINAYTGAVDPDLEKSGKEPYGDWD